MTYILHKVALKVDCEWRLLARKLSVAENRIDDIYRNFEDRSELVTQCFIEWVKTRSYGAEASPKSLWCHLMELGQVGACGELKRSVMLFEDVYIFNTLP